MNILRNLEVPYFSQRENKTVWNEKYPIDTDKVDPEGNSLAGKIVPNGKTDSKAKNSCNITCLAMMLHYFGVTSDTPDEMMRKVFEPSASELATYSDGERTNFCLVLIFTSGEQQISVCCSLFAETCNAHSGGGSTVCGAAGY